MNGTNGSTTFTDSSASAKTVTANGDAKLTTTSPKFGSACGIFDGTGDNLTVPDSADWDFGTGDFTIDYWINFSSLATNMEHFVVGDYASGKNVGINVGNTSQVQTHINGTERTVAFTWATGTWYHMEIGRSGTTIKLFIDGVEKDSWVNAADISGSTLGVKIADSDRGGIASACKIDEFRISKGICRHTAAFTPPTLEYA